jgi:hypothetical protein
MLPPAHLVGKRRDDPTRVTTLVSTLNRHLLRANQPERLALEGGD